jgi:hypothetical protein
MTTVGALSYAVWAALGLALVALVWVSHRGACAPAVEALSRVATAPVLRVVLVLGVMWAGWHLFAR